MRNAMIVALWLVCAMSAWGQEPLTLKFGIYATDKPSVVHAKFNPARLALESRLTKELGATVQIGLKIYPSYDAALDAFARGDVDFSRVGPASYVLLKRRAPELSLLAVELKKGKRTFQGVIVARKDSPITKLSELKGKRFAFGDENSTIGRYFAQAHLLAAGIDQSALLRSAFLGRHDKVFKAVEFGDFEAGALKESTFKKLNRKARNPLKVLLAFDNVTKPWIARQGLPEPHAKALIAALQGLDDAAALKALKVDRLVAADETHFAPVREAMKRSARWAPANLGN